MFIHSMFGVFKVRYFGVHFKTNKKCDKKLEKKNSKIILVTKVIGKDHDRK